MHIISEYQGPSVILQSLLWSSKLFWHHLKNKERKDVHADDTGNRTRSCFLTPPTSDPQLSVSSPPLSYPISADVCLMFVRKGVGVFLHLYCSGKHSSLFIKSPVPLLAHTLLTPKSTQEEMRGREGGEGEKQGHQNGCEERDWRSTWGRVHIIRTIYSQGLI